MPLFGKNQPVCKLPVILSSTEAHGSKKGTIAKLAAANGPAIKATQTKKKGPLGLWTTDKTLDIEFRDSAEKRPLDSTTPTPLASLTTAQTTVTKATTAETTTTQTTKVQTSATEQPASAGLNGRQIAETVVISGAVVLGLFGLKQMLPDHKRHGN